jgi:hypothetical protein
MILKKLITLSKLEVDQIFEVLWNLHLKEHRIDIKRGYLTSRATTPTKITDLLTLTMLCSCITAS